MTEEEFLHQIAPVPRFTALHFSPPDWTLGVMASTRAYITFENPEEIFVFRDKYDGYVFVDAKGTEYSAVVEYAPFQGFGKIRSKKRDIKMNTIDADSHYIAFLEALKNAENETKSESKMEFSYQLKEDTEITSTPLLEFLESKKKEKTAEKKRKADEKKKKRDDERLARKKQIAKNIPEPIKEEAKKDQGKQEARSETKDNNKKKPAEKKEKSSQDKPTSSKVEPDDDGIMVRVVPSRLDRNQRKHKDDKEDSRRDRERDRKGSRRPGKSERQAERSGQEKNDRAGDKKDRSSSEKANSSIQTKVKSEEKVDVKREVKVDVKPEVSAAKTPKSTNDPPKEVQESKRQESGKREVKKYSERRKEIRARAENRRNASEAEEKASSLEQTPESLKLSSLDVSAEPFVPGVKKPLESWVVKEGPPGKVEPFPKKSDKKDQPTEDKIDSHVESESSAMENEKSDRQQLTKEEEEKRRKERAEHISNLRNKDRPSIAIYQPRRVRIAANFNAADGRDTKVKTPESDSKMEWVMPEKPLDKPNRERKHSKEERRKSEKRERRHHRSSGDEKSEKSTRRKKKSVTEDESREMSRQNSQASEVAGSRRESGEENETSQGKEAAPKSVEDKESTETISKAIEALVIKDVETVTKDPEILMEKELDPLDDSVEVEKVEPVQETVSTKNEDSKEKPPSPLEAADTLVTDPENPDESKVLKE